MLSAAKYRAKCKGLEFNLTEDDIIVPDICPVFNIPFGKGIGWGGKLPSSPSLDRIDSTKGYIPGNVAIISHRANALKAGATPDELKAIISYMEKNGVK